MHYTITTIPIMEEDFSFQLLLVVVLLCGEGRSENMERRGRGKGTDTQEETYLLSQVSFRLLLYLLPSNSPSELKIFISSSPPDTSAFFFPEDFSFFRFFLSGLRCVSICPVACEVLIIVWVVLT